MGPKSDLKSDLKSGLVLIASQSEILRALLQRALEREGFEAKAVLATSQGHLELRQNGSRGVLLIDAELLASETGAAWCGLLESWPGLRLVATSLGPLEETALRAVARHHGVAVESPAEFRSVTSAVARAARA